MATYSQLQRSDLSGFDKEATDLVLEAVDAGWLGRMSTKGHAILRAPDGETTISVSRDSLRGRSGRNARAQFERWRRDQASPGFTQNVGAALQEAMWRNEEDDQGKPPQEEVPEEPGGRYVCEICGNAYDTLGSLGGHKRKHTLASRRQITCPICYRRYSVIKMHVKVHGEEAVAAYAEGGMRALAKYARALRNEEGPTSMATTVPESPSPEGGLRYGERAGESLTQLGAAAERASQALNELVAENEELRKENAELQTRLDLIKESVNL